MSKADEVYITCPYCEKRFNMQQAKEAQERRKALALQVLIDKGYSLREIGRLFDMHPQSVKYWAGKLKTNTASPQQPKPLEEKK